MTALKCAFWTVGLIVVACAGCGYETPATTPGADIPGARGRILEADVDMAVPSEATETPAVEQPQEAAEEKPAAKPADEQPAEEKKSEEKAPEAEKSETK